MLAALGWFFLGVLVCQPLIRDLQRQNKILEDQLHWAAMELKNYRDAYGMTIHQTNVIGLTNIRIQTYEHHDR